MYCLSNVSLVFRIVYYCTMYCFIGVFFLMLLSQITTTWWLKKKAEISFYTVLEAGSLKSVSLGQMKVSSGLHSLWSHWGRFVPCLFQRLLAAGIAWLVAANISVFASMVTSPSLLSVKSPASILQGYM